MDFLLSLDRAALLFVNAISHTPLHHAIALFLSGIGVAGVVWLLIGIVWYMRMKKTHPRVFLPLIFSLAGSWVIAELILKNLIRRSRPFVDLSVTVVGGEASGYSFPSSHATAAFAVAYIVSTFQPRLRWFFWLIALFVSLSRVYMGVHYPVDIIAGALLGIGIGKVSLGITTSARNPLKKKTKKR
jgi:undecaprenyl-diphosphatase